MAALTSIKVVRETLSDGSTAHNVEVRDGDGAVITFACVGKSHANTLHATLDRCAWIEVEATLQHVPGEPRS